MKDESWDVISAEMEGRNSRQCRERWKHYLSAVNPGQLWTPEDEKSFSTHNVSFSVPAMHKILIRNIS
jgi:hypothetical protein